MNVLFLTIGIGIGLLLSCYLLLVVLYFKQPIERKLKQQNSKISLKKGKVIEPPEGELESWITSLPKK